MGIPGLFLKACLLVFSRLALALKSKHNALADVQLVSNFMYA
jgi:hypothetical protein